MRLDGSTWVNMLFFFADCLFTKCIGWSIMFKKTSPLEEKKNTIYTNCKLFLFQYFCLALWRWQKWLTWLHSWNTLYIVNKRPSSAPIFRCGGPQHQVGWLPTYHLNFSGTFFEWAWSSLYKLWCKNHQRHCEICYLVQNDLFAKSTCKLFCGSITC